MPKIFKQYTSITKDSQPVSAGLKEPIDCAAEHDEELLMGSADKTNEQDCNATPSTASRVCPAAVENAFPTPTPPKRQQSRVSEPVQDGRQSPALSRLMLFGKSSPAPREQKSIEALRSSVSRGNSNGLSSAIELEKSWIRREVSKKNSLYFEQVLAAREPYNSARERIARDSMIVVELVVSEAGAKQQSAPDEQWGVEAKLRQTLLNDLLMILSETYHKPPNNIMISATSDSQIIVGGSTEPAYFLTVTALASEIAVVKNMRATMRLQDFFLDNLSVPSHRGVIRFQQIKEADLGTDGTTLQGAIERIEAEEKRRGSLRSRQSNRASKKSTLPSMTEMYGELEQSRSETPMLMSNDIDGEEEKHQRSEGFGKAMKTRKSIMTFWKKN